MNEIRLLLKAAARRMEMTSFIAALHVVLIVLAVIALVLALADRAPGASFIAWPWVAPALAAVGLGLAAIVWSRRRLSTMQVAVAVDERLDLKERLSTALHCDGREDTFARAAVEDAVVTARDPRSREAVRRRFKVDAPRRWWISPLLILACVGVLLAPQADLFARESDEIAADEIERARVEVIDAMEVLVANVEDKPQLNKALDGFVDDLAQTSRMSDPMQQPNGIRRDALKKVTELNKKLDEILNGEKGMQAKAVEEMMAKLDTPTDGPGKDFAEAMAAGDFSKAQKALESLMDKINGGEMSPDDQKALGEQMQALADQLNQLAEQQDALAQALQQAGLNPQLANNPEALEQALQQAQNLNQQQIQQIKQMQQAQQQAQQMCQGMGQACQQMAQGLQNGQMGQGQMGEQGGQNMQQQLNQAEQMQQLLQQAQAMANQMQQQGQGLGQGMTMNQALQQMMGGGMGDRGQGQGGEAPKTRTPTGMRIVKDDVPIIEGEIIASMLIDGTPVRGESKAKLQQVVARAAEGYDEAIVDEFVPRHVRDAQQVYFGELQKQVEAVKAAGSDVTNDDAGSGNGASEGDAGE